MKYKYLLSLLLALSLTSCAAQTIPEPTPEPEAPAITVAPIEGQALSPDGKWEVLQEGVSEGVTSGGLYPCETVKLVDRDSGEVLWEEGGAYQIHAAWPEGSEFAVIARTARTWTEVTVVSTATGAVCPVRLPGDAAIPEYTFLAEDWLSWSDEDSFELRLDGGDGVQSYWCSPAEDLARDTFTVSTVQACYEELPGAYDFTHDGQCEKVEFVTVVGDGDRVDMEGELYPLWYELHVSNADGDLLWSGSVHTVHAGWRNLFACTVDGQDYILDYSPYMGQGCAGYSYRLFSLTEQGETVLLKENGVSFDVNFGSPIFSGEYDPAAIGAFMDDVHSYLDGDCTLLVSTQDGDLLMNIPGSDYRGDDFTGGELYDYGGTWEERFIWYREMEQEG